MADYAATLLLGDTHMKGFGRVPLLLISFVIVPFAWAQQSQNQSQNQNQSQKQNQAISAFVKQAAETNAAEIAMAEVAQERASNDNVKHYAKHLQQEHELATERLQQIAQKKNVDVPNEPNRMHKEQTNRLSQLQGAEFDKAYIDAQVKAHQQAIRVFEQQAKSAQDAEIRQYAQMHLPTLREHLEQAQLLQKQTAGLSRQQGQPQRR
jgi:putative membrane protein